LEDGSSRFQARFLEDGRKVMFHHGKDLTLFIPKLHVSPWKILDSVHTQIFAIFA